MFRSVGAIIFGIASDRYGRKWPFVVNNLLFIVLELVSFRPHFLIITTHSLFLVAPETFRHPAHKNRAATCILVSPVECAAKT